VKTIPFFGNINKIENAFGTTGYLLDLRGSISCPNPERIDSLYCGLLMQGVYLQLTLFKVSKP